MWSSRRSADAGLDQLGYRSGPPFCWFVGMMEYTFSHYKWPFSIAMLSDQRVMDGLSSAEVKMAASWLPPSEPSGRANGFPSARAKRRCVTNGVCKRYLHTSHNQPKMTKPGKFWWTVNSEGLRQESVTL